MHPLNDMQTIKVKKNCSVLDYYMLGRCGRGQSTLIVYQAFAQPVRGSTRPLQKDLDSIYNQHSSLANPLYLRTSEVVEQYMTL